MILSILFIIIPQHVQFTGEKMKKKLLGNSDIEITEIGYGAWAIGGSGWEFGWGVQNDKYSKEAIIKALDMGVNWIDTAAVYGLGHSEEIVAETLEEYSGEKPYVFTKCSLVWDSEGNVKRNHNPESIRKECENSLRRLKTDVIDLYQIHWPPFDGNDEIKGAWEMMQKLKEEGKIRYAGVSNFDVEQIKICEEIAPVTSLQPPYSLINRKYEHEVLPYCKERNIGTIIYSPMGSGLLTGKMTRERISNLPDDDWRKKSKMFNEPMLSENFAIVAKMKAVAEKHKAHPGEIAIAWTLSNPNVTAAIVGARNAKQVAEVFKAYKISLDNEDFRMLEYS